MQSHVCDQMAASDRRCAFVRCGVRQLAFRSTASAGSSPSVTCAGLSCPTIGIDPQDDRRVIGALARYVVDVEPTDALQSAENVLRSAIRLAFPAGEWLAVDGAPAAAFLQGRQSNERDARQGVGGSTDLLDFADTGHLAAIVEANWQHFAAIFGDEARTRVYLDLLRGVRNTVAHSRTLVPFERDLLSGAAQHLGNLLAIYRTTVDGPEAHYPSIESLSDSFGRPAKPGTDMSLPSADGAAGRSIRLEVGDRVRWEGRAVDPRSRGILWFAKDASAQATAVRLGRGPNLSIEWVVGPEHVGERRAFNVFIKSESPYFRYMNGRMVGLYESCDDCASFQYDVSPPLG